MKIKRCTRGSRSRLVCASLAAAVLGATPALAQVETLGKGHTLLLDNGLQIWGLDTGASNFNYNNLANANFNGVMWSWNVDNHPHPKLQTLTAGQKWGKWTPYTGNPATALDAIELGKKSDLIALQVGDEQQADIENPNGQTKAWFQAAHAGNHFPDQLLYINSFFINSDAAYANFIAAANPDAIAFDSYPFNEPYGSVILPNNWLALANHFRRHALGSAIGATNNAPRPYGMYLQTYAASEGPGRAARHPGDVEMRWQQFTAWTMGFTFVNAFTVGGATSLFNGANMNSPWEPRYSQFAESARQGHNLGPALTRLISHGDAPSIIIGRDAAGNNNPTPSGWLPFNALQAPVGQRFLTSVSAVNTGTKNNGQPGDVYVGFFKPLHASFGDTTDTYFMVTNALGAYLNDPTATVADTQQQITLNFDTGYSGISTLQRLRRSDGQLEIVPLNRTTARLYQLQFTLEGGTGDLFKYNDGSPFVGFNNTLHWDADGNSSGNNPSTGAGLGGGGTWDSASNRWYNGAGNGAWAANRDAVFTGAAGAVNLASPQSINSLTFETSGYSLNGSTLNMAGQFITTDAGVTTTIGSTLAGSGGIAKAGPGTLILSNNANTYTGGTTVLGGVLQISSDGALGPAPASFTAADIILNGGTLRFGANLDIANTRGIDIGPAGGTIDTQGFSNPAGYNSFQGGFRGPGDLTKLGSGTFFAAATTGGANTSWKGRLIIKEGTWKIVASDGLPYNPPLADGLQAEQVTLDGGTWQVGATINITNARRGINVTANGGTIDTPGFDLTWAGPVAGASNGTLTKTGSGILRFTGVSFASNFNGNIQIDGGTLRLDNQNAMGASAAVNLANNAGATLHVAGNLALGSLAGGGSTGGNVNLNAVTFTVGGNNQSTTFAGAITGANGNLAKTGTGTLTLTGDNTYGQLTTVNQGALIINGTHTNAGHYTVAAGATLGGEGAITLKGATTVATVHGNLEPGAAGSIGALNINAGDLILTNTSAANFQIDLSSGAFDQVTVGDQLSYGGALNVTFTGADPDGATFPIFTFATQSGDFATMSFIGHDPLQTVSFDKTTGVLTITAVPEPGTLSLLALGATALLRRRRRC